MNLTNAVPMPPQARTWLIRMVLPIAALIGIVTLVIVFASKPAAPAPGTDLHTMPSSNDIESRFGVRFTQVGITADGGMVDLRYRVLDPDKAMAIMNMAMSGGGDNPDAPWLIVEGDGTEIKNSEVMSMKQLPEPNSIQFVLFANPRGVLESGMFVTIVVGDLRLAHVPVQ